ncbi:hypothetical protein LAZ67_9002174 [Cordylochernes scorpioides]|uniref:RNase H type-1 domain-containing protein n=1 Tax=Cordylochernes scorpioides TaxID=51811 RepID=A0ABY6KTL9_9ARAC|nr:hypothetical protein LAZ67_9002174 [Cordylochernes scorpioides]
MYNYITVSSAQRTLDLISEWCLDRKLILSPDKSRVLPIFNNPPSLKIDGLELACPDSLKILGVTFDDRLSFSPHLQRVCERALSFFSRLGRCSNARYGFGFHARRRLYLGAIEPAITYAASIWEDAAKTRAGRSQLRSTQRKFCVHAIRGFRTTPTIAAITLLRVLPLDMKVLLLSSLLRPPGSLPFRAERRPLPYIYPSPPAIPDLSPTPLPSFLPDISYYTDGSKTSSGAGSGVARVPCPGSSFSPLFLSLPLSSHCSVFQAEGFPLLTALRDIASLPSQLTIAIFSDCLSLLNSLPNLETRHPLVFKCQRILHNLLLSRSISLHWVKGHADTVGNIIADSLTRRAANDRDTPPLYSLASAQLCLATSTVRPGGSGMMNLFPQTLLSLKLLASPLYLSIQTTVLSTLQLTTSLGLSPVLLSL